MSKKNIFVTAIVLAVVFVAIGIYYLLPGYPHLLATHDINQTQIKHTAAFFVLAVICVLAALINRPRRA